MRELGARQIGVTAALLATVIASPASAGVVITQKTTVPDAGGGTHTETHTTTIEGNKLKTVTPDAITIVDLDKAKMVVLDTKSKIGTELPIRHADETIAGAFLGEYKPTGNKKTVGGFPCEEYTREFKTAAGEVSAVSCIAKEVPGAREAAVFYRKMAAKLSGKKRPAIPEGISVSDEATIKGETGAKNVPRTTKSEVTAIEGMPIDTATFAVPDGYSVRKLSNHGGKPRK